MLIYIKSKSIKQTHLLLLFCLAFTALQAQDVTVTENDALNKWAVSPSSYGWNESFEKPVQFYKDTGLRFARIHRGNNMSAYSWRKKLTVHPDWLNNPQVYILLNSAMQCRDLSFNIEKHAGQLNSKHTN